MLVVGSMLSHGGFGIQSEQYRQGNSVQGTDSIQYAYAIHPRTQGTELREGNSFVVGCEIAMGIMGPGAQLYTRNKMSEVVAHDLVDLCMPFTERGKKTVVEVR